MPARTLFGVMPSSRATSGRSMSAGSMPSSVAVRAERGRALAKRQHCQIGFKGGPLLEAAVIEQPYQPGTFWAERLKQPSALRARSVQWCDKYKARRGTHSWINTFRIEDSGKAAS